MRFDEIGEMTWPQTIFVLNQGKLPGRRRIEFPSPEAADAYIARYRAESAATPIANGPTTPPTEG